MESSVKHSIKETITRGQGLFLLISFRGFGVKNVNFELFILMSWAL